jgi:hypothetical protein
MRCCIFSEQFYIGTGTEMITGAFENQDPDILIRLNLLNRILQSQHHFFAHGVHHTGAI